MENADNANPIQGVWLNSFGSIMRLDVQDGRISGCYSSTTGSSGAYQLAGFADANPDPANALITLAFALPWLSYEGGQGDTSWHWTSTMSGVYFVDEKNGKRKLELINALNAATVFEGQNAEVGLYPESLTFELYTDQSWPCPSPSEPAPAQPPIMGTWQGSGIRLDLEPSEPSGWLQGQYANASGTFPVVGCYDADPNEPQPTPDGLRSISLVVSNVDVENRNRHSQVALVGNVTGYNGTLDLFAFQTFPLENYTSNKLSHLTLNKVGVD